MKYAVIDKDEKLFNDKGIQIGLEEKVSISTEKEGNSDRNDKVEKTACEYKTVKTMQEEVILSVHALFKRISTNSDFGYLKEMI